MTDEEKAIEYCGCNQPICIKGFKTKYRPNCSCARKKNYLDGLAEGRKEKWHDLRKDPNDLPDRMGINSKEVCIAYSDNNCTDFASYNFDKGVWERSENNSVATIVIAWCEIPMFGVKDEI